MSRTITGGHLGRPAVNWDEVLSAVIDKNRQEIADPEVIVAPKTNTIKPRCRVRPAVDNRLLWKHSIAVLSIQEEFRLLILLTRRYKSYALCLYVCSFILSISGQANCCAKVVLNFIGPIHGVHPHDNLGWPINRSEIPFSPSENKSSPWQMYAVCKSQIIAPCKLILYEHFWKSKLNIMFRLN